MKKICLKSLKIKDNTIVGHFDLEGPKEWQGIFKKPHKCVIEYSTDISSIPYSIAVIPFICNVLPIIWLFDAELIIDEVDKVFFESISEFKKGYEQMYPEFKFKGKISVSKYVENNNEIKRSAVLFSGGVDAFQTLLSHISENPLLITIWGADIFVDNVNGWKHMDEHINKTSQLYGLDYYYVKSNFREYINERVLDNYITMKKVGLEWWHDFQHGISIISHSAPLSYVLNIGTVYIASSFTYRDIGNYTCASDPSIDNYVRFMNTTVKHDGYELTRQMKIHNLCKYYDETKVRIPLRVCWESKDGENCCNCEKCYRTMLAIIAENHDPVDFGFSLYSKNVREKMLMELKNKYDITYNKRYYYIQETLRNNYSLEECPEDLKWFYISNLDSQNFVNKKRTTRKIKSIIKYILYKFGIYGG